MTRNLLDEDGVLELLRQLAARIDAAIGRGDRLVFVGIRRRGDVLAAELVRLLEPSRGVVPIGSLDITLYRDDLGQIGALPLVGVTDIPVPIDGARVVIVDDVLHTGRTIRAALRELSDFGRARRIQLCVLVDRGGRQLPIQPDYAGRVVDPGPGEDVAVRVPEVDGAWGVDLVAGPGGGERSGGGGATSGGGAEPPA